MQVYRIDDPEELDIIKEELDNQLLFEWDLEGVEDLLETKNLEEFIYEFNNQL
jgi:hypothetical protein